MKTRLVGMLAFGLMLVVAATASAQRQGGGPRGQGGPGGFGGGFGGGMMGGGRLALLAMEEVQKELKLTPDQIAAIEKLRDEMRPQRGGGPGGPGGPGGGGRGRRGAPGGNNDAQLVVPGRLILTQNEQPGQGRRGGGQLTEEQLQRFREQAEARQKQEKEKLAEILKPEQLKRLEELFLQRQGAAVLNNAEVAAALEITNDQKERLAKIRQETQEQNIEQMRELAQAGDRDAARAKMAELRKAAEDKLYGVLTDAQRKKLDGMLGAPFKFPENAGFGGRGGPGGGGRGNRGGNNNN